MDGLAPDKGLKAQVEAAKRDYIVEPRLGNTSSQEVRFGASISGI